MGCRRPTKSGREPTGVVSFFYSLFLSLFLILSSSFLTDETQPRVPLFFCASDLDSQLFKTLFRA